MEPRESGSFCRQGLGALVTKLADAVPVVAGTPVTRIVWGGRDLAVETATGRITTRAVIVTVSTNVLMSGKIRFAPDLPKRHLDAASKLSLGSYDHIALELPSNPLGLQRDDFVIEKSDSDQTAVLLANIGNSSCAAPAIRARTAWSCCSHPTGRGRCGTRWSTPASPPAGLGARDTLRLEACFHLYGNDMDEERNPIEAGLGWCCKEDTGFIGAEAVRAAREAGPVEKLVPFALSGPGIPRPGNPVVGGGVVTSGTMSPCLGIGVGLAYVPVERAEPGTELEIDVRGKMRPGRRQGQAPLRKDETLVADETYPDDLLYHPEHDWARIDGDTATFGITWYAQDQLGEVVFFEPPAVGTQVGKDEPYTEVESVKAVSDVVAPLSGEVVEVNEALKDTPEAINDDPYGEGWMVKVRLSDASERGRPDGR